MIIHSKDLLLNMKYTPDEKSQEYSAFWKNERDKCKNGIYIDNVYISGFLYYHLNFFKCQIDVLEDGRIIRKLANPYLRDNEWIIDGHIRHAEREKKGLCILGTRRLSKSVYESSYITHRATFFKGTQNVIAGLNEPDIKIITDLCEEALTGLPNAFKRGRIEDNWKKQVTLGKKTASGERLPWSSIPIRNLDGGKNTEALAGLSPFSMVIDEIGKGDWLECFSAAIPGFATPFGWRCSPLAFGTSGDMEKAKDAKKVFESPEAYNFISVDIPDEVDTKRSVFISGHYAHDFPKDDIELSKYLDIKDAPNLEKITIQVTNFERADKMIDEERALAAKSSDQSALLKITMYHPKDRFELFLTAANNNFPIEAAKSHQYWLKENPIGDFVEFYRDEKNRPQWKYSELRPISIYPVKHSDNKNAPTVIIEHPIAGLPRGTYCIGVDSYNKNESSDRINSLGSIYVLKRMCDPMGEHQHSIVAYYSGRPDDISTFYNIAYNLAEYYDGIMLPELNERFSDFFVNKKKGYYIQNAMQLAKDISPNSFARGSDKGLPPTVRNQRYGMELAVGYTLEEIVDGDGLIKLGITRIPDPMLLEEMIQYRAKTAASNGIHDINCDRIVAFYHALILAEHLDKYMPVAYQKAKSEEQTKPRELVINGFFGQLKPKRNPLSDKANKPKPKGFGFI